jgi:hypothetical protein
MELNRIIDRQVHTVPMRSLMRVLEWESRIKSVVVRAGSRCGTGLIPALIILPGIRKPVPTLRHKVYCSVKLW